MAFKESGGEPEQSDNASGLPMRWKNLQDGACPRCAEALVLFEHLDLWKCGCGFKIGAYRMQEIAAEIDDKAENGRSYGYGFSRFEDDPPF